MRRLFFLGAVFAASCVFNPQPDPPGLVANGGSKNDGQNTAGPSAATGAGGDLAISGTSGATSAATGTGGSTGSIIPPSGAGGGGPGITDGGPDDATDASMSDASPSDGEAPDGGEPPDGG